MKAYIVQYVATVVRGCVSDLRVARNILATHPPCLSAGSSSENRIVTTVRSLNVAGITVNIFRWKWGLMFFLWR